MNPRITTVTARDDHTLLLTFTSVKYAISTSRLIWVTRHSSRYARLRFSNWRKPVTASSHDQEKLTLTQTPFTSKADMRSSKHKQRN